MCRAPRKRSRRDSEGAGVLEDGRTSMDGEKGTLKGTVGEARGTRSDVHVGGVCGLCVGGRREG